MFSGVLQPDFDRFEFYNDIGVTVKFSFSYFKNNCQQLTGKMFWKLDKQFNSPTAWDIELEAFVNNLSEHD